MEVKWLSVDYGAARRYQENQKNNVGEEDEEEKKMEMMG